MLEYLMLSTTNTNTVDDSYFPQIYMEVNTLHFFLFNLIIITLAAKIFMLIDSRRAKLLDDHFFSTNNFTPFPTQLIITTSL